MGLKPRTEARRRDRDRVSLVGSRGYICEVTHTQEAVVPSSSWEDPAQTVSGTYPAIFVKVISFRITGEGKRGWAGSKVSSIPFLPCSPLQAITQILQALCSVY